MDVKKKVSNVTSKLLAKLVVVSGRTRHGEPCTWSPVRKCWPAQIILIYLYIRPKLWVISVTVGFGEQRSVVQRVSVGAEMCC